MVIFARIFLLIIFLNIGLGCEKPKILPCIKAKVIPFRHHYF